MNVILALHITLLVELGVYGPKLSSKCPSPHYRLKVLYKSGVTGLW